MKGREGEVGGGGRECTPWSAICLVGSTTSCCLLLATRLYPHTAKSPHSETQKVPGAIRMSGTRTAKASALERSPIPTGCLLFWEGDRQSCRGLPTSTVRDMLSSYLLTCCLLLATRLCPHTAKSPHSETQKVPGAIRKSGTRTGNASALERSPVPTGCLLFWEGDRQSCRGLPTSAVRDML